jgi:uncharacterized integral membrane protein (TIGR00697 family)
MKNLIKDFEIQLKAKETKFLILALSYITFITIASLLSSKIAFFGLLTFSVGAFPYSFSFTMTDVICEIWGKERANRVVTAGFFAMVIIYIFIFIAIILPPAPFWKLQKEYTQIFTTSNRVLLAGFIAYIIAQYHDVWLFALLKKATKGKHLWLRNNVSTIISQLIDTIIIVTIGFYGTIPISELPFIILGWWLIKIFLALLDTPIVYILVKWIQGKDALRPYTHKRNKYLSPSV